MAVSRLRDLFGASPAGSTAVSDPRSPDGVSLTLDELLQLRGNTRRIRQKFHQRACASRQARQRSRYRGRGLDFSEVRAYSPGDDVRLIDWNVTARSNEVHTKVFEEEREREVIFLVDFSRSMRFGTRVALKSVAAARLVAQLAWMIESSEERIGGLVCSETQHRECRPMGGKRGVFHLLRNVGSSLFISIAVAEIIRSTGVNYARLVEFINPFNPALTSPWTAGAWDASTLTGASKLSQEITRQSAMIAYLNAFGLFTLVAALAIPFALMTKPPPRRPAETS